MVGRPESLAASGSLEEQSTAPSRNLECSQECNKECLLSELPGWIPAPRLDVNSRVGFEGQLGDRLERRGLGP